MLLSWSCDCLLSLDLRSRNTVKSERRWFYDLVSLDLQDVWGKCFTSNVEAKTTVSSTLFVCFWYDSLLKVICVAVVRFRQVIAFRQFLPGLAEMVWQNISQQNKLQPCSHFCFPSLHETDPLLVNHKSLDIINPWLKGINPSLRSRVVLAN